MNSNQDLSQKPKEACMNRKNSSGEPLSLEDALQMLRAQQEHQAELEKRLDELQGINKGLEHRMKEASSRWDELQSLSRAVQQSPVSIVITDTQGVIEFVNPKFTALTGYMPEEVIGQNPRMLNSGHTPPEVFEDLWKTISAGDTWQGEVLNKAKDGTLFWENSSISPLCDEHGVTTHYLAVKEDITEKKRLSDQLVVAKELAESATLAKSSFLATMSHEIRTPMNGVIGMTGLLLDTELNAEQRDFAEIVRKSAENLLTIVNEILDFSKIEAGKLDLEILDFDLRSTVEDTAEMLAFRVADKGLELICSIDPDVPSYLRGDPGRLRQIIINLVGNAIKFTQQGEIVIKTSLASDDADVVTIRFEISDTGIGISAESLDAVFAPFSQADASTTRNYGGTGLGLSICKQLAELMGGEIGASTEIGKGSTFWFTVRFERQATQTGPVTIDDITALHADISGIYVLVVTGSITNGALLTTLLRQWGCRCETATDGESALALLKQAVDRNDPFKLVLMDQEMPGMGGRELGSRIKENKQLEPTLMVMLTTAGQRGDAAALKQLGFDGYLAKPVRTKLLHDCIALVLGRAVETPDSESLWKPQGIITRHTVAEFNKDRIRILMAEDNFINQKVARTMLDKLGYKTDVVADGREAVQALGLIDYDLVIMDCMMPVMDGFEATRTIRDPASRVFNHNVPIIALTANAMKTDRDACLAAGMNDYMAKPVRKEILTDVLEKWLFQNNAAESAEHISDDQPEAPMLIDEEELLSNFDGDSEFAASILDDVLQALPGELQILRDLAEGVDTEAICHQAHTIKGLAANISAPVLREISYSIETAAHEGNLESVRKQMSELERIILLTSEAIRSRNQG